MFFTKKLYFFVIWLRKNLKFKVNIINMKKAIFILGFLGLIITNSFTAQNDSVEIIVKDTIEEAKAEEEMTAVEEVIAVEEASTVVEEVVEEETSVSQSLKLKFIEGGPLFMSFVLIALILGLALSIERIIYLNLATTNSKKLLEDIEKSSIFSKFCLSIF